MKLPTAALLLFALPAAAQFIPLDEQEGSPDDSDILSAPVSGPSGMPGFGGTPAPHPSALLTADGEASQLPCLYGAHRAFPSRPDQSAMWLTNGAHVTLDNPHILKQGDSTCPQQGLLQGLNAALATYSASWCQLRGGFITTRALGAAALFAGGEDSRLMLDGTGLSTWGASSPGIIARHESTVSGYGITISTQGEASPALLIDSHSNLELANCRIMTTNDASPALDAKADVTLRQVDFLARQSPCCRLGDGARVDIARGRLQGSAPAAIDLGGSAPGSDNAAPARLNLHQCTVRAESGAVFRIRDEGVQLTLHAVTASGSDNILLQTEGNEQASDGQATVQASACCLSGDIRAGGPCPAMVTLGSGTVWNGAAQGSVHLSLLAGARWTLGGDSRVSSLDFGGAPVEEGLKRIHSKGCDILYDAAASPQCGGRSYALPGGGTLRPAMEGTHP